MVNVVKIKDSQVVLEDGTIEEYKPFTRMDEKLTTTKVFAVTKNGKVVKSQNNQFEIYSKKSLAQRVSKTYG